MAEVGLLPFARIALQISKAVLPRYRSRFSKHQFTQPQLLAILCLMRYEDWTFGEAEVRLGEHRELRQTLGLVSVPDFTTLYRFLKRLDDETIDGAVGAPVARFATPGTQAGSRGRGRDGLGTGSGQQVLCAAHASSRAKTVAVVTLVEVGGRGGSGSAVLVVADRATRPVERLREMDKAVEVERRDVEINPRALMQRTNLLLYETHNGDFSDAVKEPQEVLNQIPKSVSALGALHLRAALKRGGPVSLSKRKYGLKSS
jgi:hypothetical protein